MKFSDCSDSLPAAQTTPAVISAKKSVPPLVDNQQVCCNKAIATKKSRPLFSEQAPTTVWYNTDHVHTDDEDSPGYSRDGHVPDWLQQHVCGRNAVATTTSGIRCRDDQKSNGEDEACAAMGRRSGTRCVGVAFGALERFLSFEYGKEQR